MLIFLDCGEKFAKITDKVEICFVFHLNKCVLCFSSTLCQLIFQFTTHITWLQCIFILEEIRNQRLHYLFRIWVEMIHLCVLIFCHHIWIWVDMNENDLWTNKCMVNMRKCQIILYSHRWPWRIISTFQLKLYFKQTIFQIDTIQQ